MGLLLFTIALRAISIWGWEPAGRDDPRVAGIAREMALIGDYVIPRLNGRIFLEYPPLGYWPMAASLSLSREPREILAVAPIALIGIATVLLTAWIGSVLAGVRVGLASGFILSSMAGFHLFHCRSIVDPFLLFFVTLSLSGFAAGLRRPETGFRFFALFYLGMAGGFLTKGLLGIGIPAIAAVAFLGVRRILKMDLPEVRRMGPIRGALLLLFPVLLWAALAIRKEGTGIIGEVVRQSLWRFFSPSADHAGPVYFYIGPAFLNLLPWTPLPLALLLFRSGPRSPARASPGNDLIPFALTWCIAILAVLSLASAKRTLYLGPLYPPFALLAGLAWERLRESRPALGRLAPAAPVILILAFTAFQFLVVIPEDARESYRPIFEEVAMERKGDEVLLYTRSEALQGAAFFYLGERVKVLWGDDLKPYLEDPSAKILVMSTMDAGDPLTSSLPGKGFRLLLEKKIGNPWVRVWTNRR